MQIYINMSPIFALCLMVIVPNLALADLPNAIRIVLEEQKRFIPSDLFLRRGDTIILVNNDDHIVHHAFIEADRFTFDASDQEPGAQTTLTVKGAGDYVIACGIHPKMKLTIHVQ